MGMAVQFLHHNAPLSVSPPPSSSSPIPPSPWSSLSPHPVPSSLSPSPPSPSPAPLSLSPSPTSPSLSPSPGSPTPPPLPSLDPHPPRHPSRSLRSPPPRRRPDRGLLLYIHLAPTPQLLQLQSVRLLHLVFLDESLPPSHCMSVCLFFLASPSWCVCEHQRFLASSRKKGYGLMPVIFVGVADYIADLHWSCCNLQLQRSDAGIENKELNFICGSQWLGHFILFYILSSVMWVMWEGKSSGNYYFLHLLGPMSSARGTWHERLKRTKLLYWHFFFKSPSICLL